MKSHRLESFSTPGPRERGAGPHTIREEWIEIRSRRAVWTLILALCLQAPAFAGPAPTPTPLAGLDDQAPIRASADHLTVRFQAETLDLPVFTQGGEPFLTMGAPEAVRLFSLLGITARWSDDGRTVTVYGAAHYVRWSLRSDVGSLDGRDVRRPNTLIPSASGAAAISLQALAELLEIRFESVEGGYAIYPVIERMELSRDGGDRRIVLRGTAPFDFLAGSEGSAVRLTVRGVRWGAEERAFHFEDADATVEGTGSDDDPISISFQMPEHWRGEVTSRFLLTEAAIRIAPAFRVARDYGAVTLSNLRAMHSIGEQYVTLDASGRLQYFWRFEPSTRTLVVDVPQAQAAGDLQAQAGPEASDLQVLNFRSAGLDFVRLRVVVNPGYGFDVRIAEDGRLVLRFASESALPITAYSGKGFEPAGGDAGGNVIVLDPGHGGSDPGAMNRSLGIREADITLDICTRMRDILTRQGWKVYMTRTEDRDLTWAGSPDAMELGARADVANRNNAELFISVHCNAAASSGYNGTSFHWYKREDYELARSLNGALIPAGIANKGPIRNRFAVLRRTSMQAVLVETAFITNPHDARLLADPNMRQRIAEMLSGALTAHHARNVARQGQPPQGR